MAVAACPDKVTDIQITLLRNHVREQRIARNIKRNSEEDIAASLIELAGQLSLSHIELEEHMARRECHLVNLSDIPGRDDQSTGVRIRFNLMNQIGNLINITALRGFPVAPLNTVDRT